MKRRIALILVFIVLFAAVSGCASAPSIYADAENWAYLAYGEDKSADVFFVCPTVFSGKNGESNMELDDAKTRESFLGATNMEIGIYDGKCRVYAPYYRQASLHAYGEGGEALTSAVDTAYADVREAFMYYMEKENAGRPFVLAGFSQGAEITIRLLKEFGAKYKEQLIAAYAIGWRLTAEETATYPALVPATGESDTGVIICFNSEAESVTSSMMIPEGVKSFSINPLNWRTDGTVADKSENLGACFTLYDGSIKSEIAGLCGAYIDPVRGALKVTDVTSDDYPPVLSIFEPGIYHLYDYQFFYRNLQKNVITRVEAYEAKNAA